MDTFGIRFFPFRSSRLVTLVAIVGILSPGFGSVLHIWETFLPISLLRLVTLVAIAGLLTPGFGAVVHFGVVDILRRRESGASCVESCGKAVETHFVSVVKC